MRTKPLSVSILGRLTSSAGIIFCIGCFPPPANVVDLLDEQKIEVTAIRYPQGDSRPRGRKDVTIEIRRLEDAPLSVSIPMGTHFVFLEDPSHSILSINDDIVIELTDGEWTSAKVQGICVQACGAFPRPHISLDYEIHRAADSATLTEYLLNWGTSWVNRNADPDPIGGRSWANNAGDPGQPLPFLEYLIDAGADPNGKDEEGKPFLLREMKNRTGTHIIQILIEKGADASYVFDGRSLLWQTADWTVVTALLAGGADPNIGATDYTYLHESVAERRSRRTRLGDKLARVLVEHGMDINATTDRGFTPIMTAAMTDNWAAMQYLAAQGARISNSLPASVPVRVRALVDLLGVSEITVQANAMRTLGFIGAPAAPAIPFIEALLDDRTGLVLSEYVPVQGQASRSFTSIKEETIAKIRDAGG